MNNYIEIVITPDENYAMPCGVLITSILYTNPGINFRFHIISENLTNKSKELLVKCLQSTNSIILFYAINSNNFKGLPSYHNSFAVYIPFFIADILPVEIDKIIYLDADMIVVNSLEELWKTDITDFPIAGTLNISNNSKKHCTRLGYDPSKGYYHIGTNILNLKYWRDNNILNNCLNVIGNTSKELLELFDMDILNIVLVGKWKHLSPQYNFFQNYYMPLESKYMDEFLEEIYFTRKNPVIIHFISRPKPWHKDYYMPLTKIWLFYYRLTPWKNKKLEYYHKGIKKIKYLIKNILCSLKLYKFKWNLDPKLDIMSIINNIFIQIENCNKRI